MTMNYYSRFTHFSSRLIKTLTSAPPRISLAPQPRTLHARYYNTDAPSQPSENNVSAIVDEVMGLTLLEVMDLVEVLREKQGGVSELPLAMLMVPGMAVPRGVPKGGGGGGGGGEEVKVAVEKTAFDVRLEGFEAAAKIKVIKEVRTFTSLGLKEAKELVEKVPAVLRTGVSKEEAERIIAKMKEVGAKVSME